MFVWAVCSIEAFIVNSLLLIGKSISYCQTARPNVGLIISKGYYVEAKQEAFVNRQQKTRLVLLILFTLGTLSIGLVGEAFKTNLIWYIRFPDFIDLVITAPLTLACLALLHEHFEGESVPRWLRRAFLLFAMVYIYGHAMHMASNAIDTFAIEIREYKTLLPDDLSELIYFIDEVLSHWLLFLARYFVVGGLLVLEAKYIRSLVSGWVYWLAIGTGILYGMMDAVVFVEGQTVYLLSIVLAGLGGLWFRLWKSSGVDLKTFWRSGPVVVFVTVLLPSMVIGLGGYVWLVGGFKQFSDLDVLG